MSNLIATDLQGQEVSSGLITLFELELPDGTFVFFHPGTNASLGSVQFRNKTTTAVQTYEPFPMMIDGLEVASDGALSRPTFSVANIGTNFKTLLGGYTAKDLVGQRITRRQTLEKYLVGGGSHDASMVSDTELNKVTYVIDRISLENSAIITFEVTAIYDLEGITVPRREQVGKFCSWVYQGNSLYDKGGCTWKQNSHAISAKLFNDATCHVTSGSAIVTHDANADIVAGLEVGGTGITSGTTIATRDSSTQFTLSANATAGDGSEITLTFMSPSAVDQNLFFDVDNNPLIAEPLTGDTIAAYSASSVSYTNNSYVTHGGKFYQSQFTFTSGSGTEPGTTAGSKFWKEARTYTDYVNFQLNSCDTTSGDATVTHDADNPLARVVNDLTVQGPGIPDGTTIDSGATGTTHDTNFELSANATATATNVTLQFGRMPYGQPTTGISATITSGSKTVTHDGGSRITKGLSITSSIGSLLPADATVASVTSDTQFELNANAVGTGGPLLSFTRNYAVGELVKAVTYVGDEELTTIWKCTVAHASTDAGTYPSPTSSFWDREEICGKLLSSCKCRFQGTFTDPDTTNSRPSSIKNSEITLPFGAFLGIDKF
jgi:lambda family phage minor tail protein L